MNYYYLEVRSLDWPVYDRLLLLDKIFKLNFCSVF